MKEGKRQITPRQRQVIAVTASLILGGFLFSRLVAHKLDHSAALFIGVPTVLAILLALTPHGKSAAGMVVKGITIALLLSAIVFGEGFVCLMMSAPLFYLFGMAFASPFMVDEERGRHYAFGMLPVLLLMSLEGVTDEFSFPRDETVSVEKVVLGTPEEVASQLAQVPRLSKPLPFYLRLGFPQPVQTAGSGLAVGSERQIHFAGGEGEPGDLILTVIESQPGLVRFGIVKDTSHIATWLRWQESQVTWEPCGPKHSRVRWTLRYQRLLDPAWYFGPWQQYAVSLTAEALIDNLATRSRSF